VANIKSQIKRIKTNEKAYLRNKSVSSSIKTAVRKFREAVAKGDAATTTTELRAASKALDIAVAKGGFYKSGADSQFLHHCPYRSRQINSCRSHAPNY